MTNREGVRERAERWADESSAVSVRIRQARRARRVSQARLSEALNVDHSYLSRIEAGTRRPSLPMLLTMAAELGVSAEWLLSGRGVGPELDQVATAPGIGAIRAARPEEV